MQNHYLQESTSLLTFGYIKIELATSVILQDSVIWIKCEKRFAETSHKWRAFIIVHALRHGPRLRSITHNVCLTNTKELISPKSSYHRHGINKQSPSSIVQWMYSTSRNEGNFVKFTLIEIILIDIIEKLTNMIPEVCNFTKSITRLCVFRIF